VITREEQDFGDGEPLVRDRQIVVCQVATKAVE
jgi:hypothetical protein